MKKVRRGHRLQCIIYISVIIALLIAEIITLKSLDQKYQVLRYEKIQKPTTENNEVSVQQGAFTHTRDIQMNVNEFTYEEAQLLLKVAQAEAGNQGTDGMWLVMSVVLNRVNSGRYPDTISEVIYENHKGIYQFSTVPNGAIDRADVSSECHEALARIESGDVAPEIIGFESTKNKTLDKYFSPAFSYRDHQFYTLKEE